MRTYPSKSSRSCAWGAILQIVVVALVILGGCRQKPAAKPAGTQPSAPALAVPVEVRVKQRSTTAVPGSDGSLFVTIDDITRGQVSVSLATDAGAAVLAPRSMSAKDTATFDIAGAPYVLTLTALDNSLTGEDFAQFVISSPSSDDALTEEAKIERLIQAIADLREAKFIRNNAEHDANEAADHLRSKWNASRDRIKTAEQFIEHIASKSSLSGEPYQIKLPDGRVVKAGDYFRERLREIETGRQDR